MNRKTKNIFHAMIDYLHSYNQITDFKYYDEFFVQWECLLKKHAIHEYFFCSSQKADSNTSYFCNIKIYNTHIKLIFNIHFILNALQMAPTEFSREFLIFNKNKNDILYRGYPCIFNYYNSCKRQKSYYNLDNILFVPLPLEKNPYIIIDGNHRISHLIDNGIYSIPALLCSSNVTARSLSSTLQTAIYVCLEDCHIIATSKGNDEYIKKKLSIFDPNSFINNIEKRIKPENKL